VFTYSHTVETPADVAAVWRLYSDLALWPQWDGSVESATLTGPFVVGSEGTLVIKEQGPFPLRLTEVTPLRSFSDETPMPDMGIVLSFSHLLEPLPNGGTRITHSLQITGPAAATVGPELGPMVVGDMPEAMDSLAALAAQAPVAGR
jgi:hypothetical protein